MRDILEFYYRNDEKILLWDFVAEWNLSGIAPHNIWLGVSVDNPECIEKHISELLKIPARLRFLSVDPLISPVRLDRIADLPIPICRCKLKIT